MKKIFRIRAVLALLFAVILLRVPSACADSWVALGSWNFGGEIYCLLTESVYAPETDYTVDGYLPLGCEISRWYENDLSGLALEGTPEQSGEFSFTLYICDQSFTYSLIIAPDAPTVYYESAPTGCSVGSYAEFSVGASVRDGGDLTYQWYMDGEALPGAVESLWPADTSSAGSHTYYCEVFNHTGSLAASTFTDPVTLSVSRASAASVSVFTRPTQETYAVGDLFNSSGLSLLVTYDDGSSDIITEGYTCSPSHLTSAGTQDISVYYENKACSLQVNVESLTDDRTLSVITLPLKTVYETGSWLDTTGLQLRISGSSSYYDVSTGYTCTPYTLDTPGTQVVTVYYDGLSCSFNVTVSEPSAELLSVKTLPEKTEFRVGDTLDTTGLILEETNGSSVTTIQSGYTCSPRVFTSAGQQTVTVTYGKLSTSFNVNVTMENKTAASAAPVSTPQPSPTAQQVSTAPLQVSVPSQSRSTGLVLFIAVIALLALLVLGVYIYLARADNIDETPLGRFLQELLDKFSRK